MALLGLRYRRPWPLLHQRWSPIPISFSSDSWIVTTAISSRRPGLGLLPTMTSFFQPHSETMQVSGSAWKQPAVEQEEASPRPYGDKNGGSGHPTPEQLRLSPSSARPRHTWSPASSRDCDGRLWPWRRLLPVNAQQLAWLLLNPDDGLRFLSKSSAIANEAKPKGDTIHSIEDFIAVRTLPVEAINLDATGTCMPPIRSFLLGNDRVSSATSMNGGNIGHHAALANWLWPELQLLLCLWAQIHAQTLGISTKEVDVWLPSNWSAWRLGRTAPILLMAARTTWRQLGFVLVGLGGLMVGPRALALILGLLSLGSRITNGFLYPLFS